MPGTARKCVYRTTHYTWHRNLVKNVTIFQKMMRFQEQYSFSHDIATMTIFHIRILKIMPKLNKYLSHLWELDLLFETEIWKPHWQFHYNKSQRNNEKYGHQLFFRLSSKFKRWLRHGFTHQSLNYCKKINGHNYNQLDLLWIFKHVLWMECQHCEINYIGLINYFIKGQHKLNT